ncbi:hypothetical protein [Galbitalea soli]|uniref:Uncharacterized protein n=1 Tax=Galbitalea soli TaxID=1268042 RepID=A0A7C9TQM5_9MICO|nr:hypothetical protein [Galbitalea soli]NEM90744.1 hypothetical protein [Galbitalea soli]NYJ31462.1 hypothetical protein [Galbitalea soli]
MLIAGAAWGTAAVASGAFSAPGRAASTHAAEAEVSQPVLPPGAVEVPDLASPYFDRPAIGPATCSGAVDVTRYWTVDGGTVGGVTAYILEHLATGYTVSSAVTETQDGSAAHIAEGFSATPKSNSRDRRALVYGVARETPTTIGIRVDGEVVPDGSRCASTR